MEIIKQNKVFLWIAFSTLGILTITFLLSVINIMNWGPADFVVMGALIFGTASTFFLIAKKINSKYRITLGFVLLLAFFWFWAELAVGIFTTWGS